MPVFFLFVSRRAAGFALNLRLISAMLVACVSAVAGVAQSLIVNGPGTVTPGGAVNVGSYSSSGSGSSGPSFSFTSPVTITSVAYDAAYGGVQELSIRRVDGCPLNQPTTGACGVETEIAGVYPGLRSGTLRIITDHGVFLLPVTYTVTLPQISLMPGVLSSPVTLGGTAITQTGTALAVDTVGDLFLTDTNNNVVRRVDATTGAVTVFAGKSGDGEYLGDGGPATSAAIMIPKGVSVSPASDVYILSIATGSNDIVRKVDFSSGTISTAATEITGRSVSVFAPAPDGAAVVDQAGTIYVAVPFKNGINAIANGVTTTIVNGTVNGQPCNTSPTYQPIAMTVGGGYLYFASQAQIFKISTDTSACQPVIPVAGTGLGGNDGDWGPALSAHFGQIAGLALDAAGNLYLADSQNNEVRVVNANTGTISPIAGPNTYLYSVTVLQGLSSLAMDPRGNLYVLGTNGTVQKIDVSQARLIFDSTLFGTTSTDSPKYVYATNIGNTVQLAGTAAIPINFGVDPSSQCVGANGLYGALGAGVTCFEAFDFTPVNINFGSGTVNLGGATISLHGSGIGPAVNTTDTVSPANIDFGTVTQGSSSGTWTVNIANTGANPLTVVSASLSDLTNFQVGGNCSAPIAPYASCNLTLVFKPQSAGSFHGALTLVDNAQNGVQNVFFTGTATSNAAALTVSPSSVNFGTLQPNVTSPVWTVFLGNTGGSALNLFNIFLSDPVDYAITNNTCSSTIAAYGSCFVSMTFTPKGTGSWPGGLVIDLVNGPETVVALAGSGATAAAPTINLSPSAIDFGNVGVGNSSGVWTVYVGNTGSSPMTISSMVLSDTTNFNLFNTCGTIAAYSSCEFTTTFTPTQEATLNATIVLTDNVGTGSQTVTLTGNGTKPQYSVQVTPAAMTLHAGQSGTAAFTFTPTGGFTGSAAFMCSGLPAGASCSFSPSTFTADGSDRPQSGKLTITTAGISNHAALRGEGGGIAFAGLMGVLGVGCLRRRRRAIPALLAVVVLAGMAAMSGCGAGIFSGTPVGAHTVQVMTTATATQKTQSGTANVGTTTQAVPLTLTIVE